MIRIYKMCLFIVVYLGILTQPLKAKCTENEVYADSITLHELIVCEDNIIKPMFQYILNSAKALDIDLQNATLWISSTKSSNDSIQRINVFCERTDKINWGSIKFNNYIGKIDLCGYDILVSGDSWPGLIQIDSQYTYHQLTTINPMNPPCTDEGPTSWSFIINNYTNEWELFRFQNYFSN